VLNQHLNNLYQFYGELSGVRIARKHIGWYIKGCCTNDRQEAESFRKRINQVDDANTQIRLVTEFFNLQTPTLAA